MATSPGRIVREFNIPLPRPRDINSPELAGYASQIAAALKGRAEGAASE
jgi:NitT/TauT family transport system ATP-binding protein